MQRIRGVCLGYFLGGGKRQGRLQAQKQRGEAAVFEHTSGVGQRAPVAHREVFRGSGGAGTPREALGYATTGNGKMGAVDEEN